MRLFHSSEHHRAELLSRLGRFAALTPADVRKVVKAASTVQFAPGDVLTQEGDRASGAYVVLSGELDVTQAGAPVRSLGPGELVGEIGVVASPVRTATVTARTATEALHFTPAVVERLAKEVPAFLAALRQAADRRLTRDRHTE